MNITKSAKRLMATVMTTALALTGLVVAPKTVSAAEAGTQPQVKVLGATLRLDGTAGTQSMRVGIQVTNASKVKDCGINLTVGDKTKTISTENSEYQKIYDYNKEHDAVVYTAVINGIPKDNFSTDIGVQGIITDIEENKSNSGEAVTKSVNSIVDVIKKDDNTIELANNGMLVRKVDELAVNAEKNYGSRFAISDENVEYDTTKSSYKITSGNIVWTSGGIANVPHGGAGKYFCELTGQSDADATLSLGRHSGASLGSGIIQKEEKTITFNTFEETNGAYPVYTLVSSAYPFFVKSFKVYKVLEQEYVEDITPSYPDMTKPEGEGWKKLSLQNVTKDGITYHKDGDSLSVKDVGEFDISLGGETIESGKKVEVFLRGEDIGGSLFRVWLGDSNAKSDIATFKENMKGDFNSDGSGGAFEITCSLTTTAPVQNVHFKNYNAWQDHITTTGKIDHINLTTVWYRIVE